MHCCWHLASRCPLLVGAALHRTTENVQQLSPSRAVRVQGASSHLCCPDVWTHPTPIQHRHTNGQQNLPQQTQHGHEVHLLWWEVDQVTHTHIFRLVYSDTHVQDPCSTMCTVWGDTSCALLNSHCMFRTTDTGVDRPAAFQHFNWREAIRVESVAS